ncbi:MAG TPA: hypothetical protein VIX59_09445 [Candidatus Binataceae bacterium]
MAAVPGIAASISTVVGITAAMATHMHSPADITSVAMQPLVAVHSLAVVHLVVVHSVAVATQSQRMHLPVGA